ncbi:MAG TPA: helix-turn-helix transcriptional regulator [Chitinophagaceae bacterium]|nr:helix-turn-helix transcriptional regulator [Chitinophagaceae bacterium]
MGSTTLKILREINDYTQDYVAQQILGISQNTYSRLEQDPSRITAEQAQKLADLYQVSLANLLSEASPVITFKDSVTGQSHVNGYVQSNTNHFHEGEVRALREENERLNKRIDELLELIRKLTLRS